MRRIILLALLICILMLVVAPGFAQFARNIKETEILTFNGTAWVRVTKGQIYGATAASSTVTQTANTGAGFTVTRDKAAANTDDALVYVNNDNAGDDQSTVKIKQDGTGNILDLYDGASLVWSVSDGGSMLLTTGATTGYAASINAASITSGDGLKITVADATLDGGYYLRCTDGAADDFKVGEGGAVTVGGALTAASVTVTGATALNGGLTMDTDKFSVADTSGNTVIGGTLQAKALATVVQATGSRVCTSSDYGKTIILTNDGAVAVTLPANGAAAGSWIMFLCAGTDNTAATVAAATADTLIAPNDATADSVTYGAGHRIGACLLVISTGTYWVAVSVGSTTMTVNT